MTYVILLFLYTIALTFIIFRQILWLNAFILISHLLLLLLLNVPLRKIKRSFERLLPFLIIIVLTTGFFTPGRPIFSLKIVVPVLFTYEGLFTGLSAALAFCAIASTSLFYQVKLFNKSFLKLSQNLPLLLPFFLSHSFLGKGRWGKSKKEKLNFKERFAVSKKIEQLIIELSQTHKNVHNFSPRILLITAVSLFIFSLKLARIFPGIPYASGQKLLFIIPLLFFVSKNGKGFSATITSFNYSLLILVFGQQGQLGIFDLLRTVLLGFLIDVATRFLPRKGIFLFLLLTLLGGILGFLYGIFSAFVVTLMNVPKAIYVLYAPRFAFNAVFGLLSGSLAFYLVRLNFPIEKMGKTAYNNAHAKKKPHRSSKTHPLKTRRRNSS